MGLTITALRSESIGGLLERGVGMIARVGVFEGSPDRFRDGSYEWIKQALDELPGFRGLFHLSGANGVDRSLSVSFWDDEDAARAADEAVARKRQEVGVASSPPTAVETYDVVDYP